MSNDVNKLKYYHEICLKHQINLTVKKIKSKYFKVEKLKH